MRATTVLGRVLLVEEDAQQRSFRATVLATHGYDVDCAVSAEDARQQCLREIYDMVLVGLSDDSSLTFGLVQAITKANPAQPVGFLLHENHRLCPVWFDGKVVVEGEGPGDLVDRVAALISRR